MLAAWEDLRRKPWLRPSLIGLFFGIAFLIGLLSFRDFGVPFDEGTSDSLGHDAYEYVVRRKPWPQTPEYRYHGTVVELPLYAFIHSLHLREAREGAYIRHFAVFLFFFVGIIAFYLLARRRLGTAWSLLGCAFFVLSPRIFSHAFYNSRDIPNMALFTVAMYSLFRLGDRGTVPRILLHSFLCALVIGLRVTGVILPVFTIIFLFIITTKSDEPDRWKRFRTLCGIYLIALCVATILVWPFLWEHPLRHFLDAIQFMGTLSSSNFLLGKTFERIPWYYIPLWIAITTPLLYTILFLTGTAGIGSRIARHPLRFAQDHTEELMILFWFFGPIIAIMVFRSQIYQEWRHVFFIYPAFLLIALDGTRWIWTTITRTWNRRTMRTFLGSMIALPILSTSIWMYRNHPLQGAYYILPPGMVVGNFDLDYWGLAYRPAIQYILDHDDRPVISYYATQDLAFLNGAVFFPEERGRLFPVKYPAFAQYIIDHYRPEEPHFRFPDYPELHAIAVDGMKIATIQKGPFDPEKATQEQIEEMLTKLSEDR